MNPSTKRPVSVWIALVVLATYISLLIFILFIGPPDPSVLDAPETDELIIGMVEFVSVMIALAVAFWALATRRQWGRWFVAGAIAYTIGTIAYEHLFLPDTDPESQTDLLLGAAFLLSPLLLVVILVSFGEGVKKYFSEKLDN